MNDPPRLVDDSPTAVERALLEAGADYHCSDASRNKTLAALGLAGTAAVSAATLGIASTSWFAKIGWTKLLIGVSTIGAATALPLSYQAWQRHKLRVPVAIVSAPNNLAASQSTASLNLASPVALPATVPVEAASGASSGSAPGATASKSTSNVSRADAPAPGLAEELALLDAARALLARGDAAGALARLDAYMRAYPKGRLQLEAEVMRIDALTKSGQTSAARKRAETFLRKYPNSVLASRVRALLGS